MKYIDPKTGLNFTNVNKPVLLTGGKISSDKYNVSSPYASVITDEQLPVAKLLNALDIDWCNAILPNSDLENGGPIGIQSTADLLKLIDNMNTHYISAIGAIYSLLPSQSVIMFNRNTQGELEGEETLTCQVNKIEPNNVTTYDLNDPNNELEQDYEVYYIDDTLDPEHPEAWEGSKTISADSGISKITLVLKKSNTLLDLKTIPVIEAPAQGPQGSQGVAGLNGTPGSNGQNGQYVVFAYKNAESCPQKPEDSTTINNLIDGWSTTPADPVPPEVTWMTQCLVNGSGQYETWTTPIRITGAQGANGTDGEDGADGINGSCVEFIYTRNNTGIYPSIPVAVNIETTDDWSGEDQNSIIWTDNPQGVQSDMKWEFVSMRTKPAGATSWQAFSSPVIWSKWGETGIDGDGVEYIYKHFNTEKTFESNNYNPAQWEVVQEDEYYGPTVDGIDYRWSDGPQGVNAEFQYEYVAVRKKKHTGWQAYSTPTLWAKYGPQGAQGVQGSIGQAGKDGQNGSHWMFAYKNSATQPDAIESGTSLEHSGWDASPINPTPPAVTWMSQTLVDTNNQYGDWTDPIRITGAQGEAGADGADGAAGANGSSIEFIYKRFNKLQTFDNNYNTYDNPVAWNDLVNENYQDNDYRGPEGHQWTDNPQGVQSDLMFEYVSTRVKPAGTNTSWGPFSTPVVWSKWGEKGQDGDGVEYIYKHFTESQAFTDNDLNPAHWDASQTSGYQGIENFKWSDGPQGINSEYQYEYVSIRKKIDGTWGKFTVPVIWAKFNTAPTIEIRDNHWYIDGIDTGVIAEGQNGAGVEIKGIIKYDSDLVNDGHVTPKNGSQVMASKGDCYVCEDNGHIYVWNNLTWVDLGEFRGAPGQNGNDGADGHSSYMHIAYATSITFENNTPVSAVGFTTVNTANSSYDWIGFLVDENSIDSDNFADYKWNYVKGIDGNGYEYVYMRTKTSIRPEISDNVTDANGHHASDDEYLPAVSNPNECQAEPSYDDNSQPYYQFTDDPHGVQSIYKYEWQSIRKKVNGSWDVFSKPALLAKWAEDGAQGAQGAQGVAGANGINGQNGKAGLWYDYAGEWTEGKSVTNTEQIGYYVSIGNQFYMNVKDSGIANNIIPVNNDGLNEGWQSMSNDRNYYIGKAFFGEYAAFGNAIINGDWMISKNGVIDGREYSADEFVEYLNEITGTSVETQHAYLLFDPQFPQNNPMHLEFTGEWNESQINFDNPESNDNLDNVYIKDVEFYLTANKDYKISLYLYNNNSNYTYEYCLLDNENNYINLAQGDVINGQYIQHDPVYKITINNENTDNYDLLLTTSYSGTYKLRIIRKKLSNTININTTNKPSYFYAYVKPLIVFEPKYALNLLTGAVYEHDLHVNGIIKAQALYPQTRVINDDTTIDNSNLANMYIIRNDDEDNTISIKLPDTKFNQNLELKFFVESGNATINFTGQTLYTPIYESSTNTPLRMIRRTARFGDNLSQNYLTGVGALPLYTLTTLVATYFPEILFTERTANIYNYGLAYNIDPRSSSFVIGENGTQATFIGNQSSKYENTYKAGHQSFTFEEIFTKYNDFVDSLEDPNNMYKLEIDPISGFQGAQASLNNIHTYNKQNEYAIEISKSEGQVKDEAEYVWVTTTGYLTETNTLNGLYQYAFQPKDGEGSILAPTDEQLHG